MTKRKEYYKRTQQAIDLFKSFFDTEEDYVAFKLAHDININNSIQHGRLEVLNNQGVRQSFSHYPAWVNHDGSMDWWLYGQVAARINAMPGALTLTIGNSKGSQAWLRHQVVSHLKGHPYLETER